MEKHEIIVGKDYAYLIPNLSPHQPLRATATSEPEGGYVEVTLYHPDSGQTEERVKTRELVGAWNDEPEGKPQYDAALKAAHERGETLTWSMIAAERYGQVQRQRALASRLSNLGIYRRQRNYAGSGGSSQRAHDTDLQLNYDEIEFLLDRIERGTTAVTLPPVQADLAAVPETDEVS